MATTEAQTEERCDAGNAPAEKNVSSTVPAISSGLAGLVLEHNLRQGQAIKIPSLGISFGGEPAQEPTRPKSNKRR